MSTLTTPSRQLRESGSLLSSIGRLFSGAFTPSKSSFESKEGTPLGKENNFKAKRRINPVPFREENNTKDSPKTEKIHQNEDTISTNKLEEKKSPKKTEETPEQRHELNKSANTINLEETLKKKIVHGITANEYSELSQKLRGAVNNGGFYYYPPIPFPGNYPVMSPHLFQPIAVPSTTPKKKNNAKKLKEQKKQKNKKKESGKKDKIKKNKKTSRKSFKNGNRYDSDDEDDQPPRKRQKISLSSSTSESVTQILDIFEEIAAAKKIENLSERESKSRKLIKLLRDVAEDLEDDLNGNNKRISSRTTGDSPVAKRKKANSPEQPAKEPPILISANFASSEPAEKSKASEKSTIAQPQADKQPEVISKPQTMAHKFTPAPAKAVSSPPPKADSPPPSKPIGFQFPAVGDSLASNIASKFGDDNSSQGENKLDSLFSKKDDESTKAKEPFTTKGFSFPMATTTTPSPSAPSQPDVPAGGAFSFAFNAPVASSGDSSFKFGQFPGTTSSSTLDSPKVPEKTAPMFSLDFKEPKDNSNAEKEKPQPTFSFASTNIEKEKEKEKEKSTPFSFGFGGDVGIGGVSDSTKEAVKDKAPPQFSFGQPIGDSNNKETEKETKNPFSFSAGVIGGFNIGGPIDTNKENEKSTPFSFGLGSNIGGPTTGEKTFANFAQPTASTNFGNPNAFNFSGTTTNPVNSVEPSTPNPFGTASSFNLGAPTPLSSVNPFSTNTFAPVPSSPGVSFGNFNSASTMPNFGGFTPNSSSGSKKPKPKLNKRLREQLA